MSHRLGCTSELHCIGYCSKDKMSRRLAIENHIQEWNWSTFKLNLWRLSNNSTASELASGPRHIKVHSVVRNSNILPRSDFQPQILPKRRTRPPINRTAAKHQVEMCSKHRNAIRFHRLHHQLCISARTCAKNTTAPYSAVLQASPAVACFGTTRATPD